MAITNYTELKAAIASWLNRSDLTSVIPDFIALAEPRINADVRIKEMEARATASASTATRYLALPTRFAEMRRLQLNTSPIHELKFVPHSGMNSYYSSTAGKPLYFTVVGGEVEFSCKPDTAYTVEMSYWAKVAALSASVADNVVLTNFPNIYLFCSLSEAALYLKHKEDAEWWSGRYMQEVERANAADKQGRWVGPMTVRPS